MEQGQPPIAGSDRQTGTQLTGRTGLWAHKTGQNFGELERIESQDRRLPAVPAASRLLPGRGLSETAGLSRLRLLGPPGSQLRRSAGKIVDRRAGAGCPWRQ